MLLMAHGARAPMDRSFMQAIATGLVAAKRNWWSPEPQRCNSQRAIEPARTTGTALRGGQANDHCTRA